MKGPHVARSSASKENDAIIRKSAHWQGKTLARLRALVAAADPAILEEVKWSKPSRPEGVPVWSHEGILCIGEMLKNAVRLTFPKGAQLKDPRRLFNTRLDSKTVRAIDIHQDEPVNEAALKLLIVEAVRANKSQASKR
jgi:hypothetical protein